MAVEVSLRSTPVLGSAVTSELVLNGSDDAAMARGKLRIYLGAAPGVGKTYAMLTRAGVANERGTDVVVGYVETHGRLPRPSQIGDLEIVPAAHDRLPGPATSRRWTSMRCSPASPSVVLVDELAHTNVPGCRTRSDGRTSRSCSTPASTSSRRSTSSTSNRSTTSSSASPASCSARPCPMPSCGAADQIELVDMTPEALRRRMAHGNIYAPEQVDAALGQLLPARQPRRAPGAGAALGGRQRRRGARRTTGSATASPSRGRRGSGSWWRSRARPAASISSVAARAWRRAPAPSWSASTSAAPTGWPAPDRTPRAAPAAARPTSAALHGGDRHRHRRRARAVRPRRERTQLVLGASRRSRWAGASTVR